MSTKEAEMDDAMVTGRMSAEKKAAGARVLEKAGLNASQAVNLLYDKLEEEQNADFLLHRKPEPREAGATSGHLFVAID